MTREQALGKQTRDDVFINEIYDYFNEKMSNCGKKTAKAQRKNEKLHYQIKDLEMNSSGASLVLLKNKQDHINKLEDTITNLKEDLLDMRQDNEELLTEVRDLLLILSIEDEIPR